MLIVIFDNKATLVSLGYCLLVEFLRVLLAYWLAKPSDQIRILQEQKLQTNLELATIKSIQVELVRHSKLTRKVIKLSQDIEKLQSENAPKSKKMRNLFRILRVIAYIAFCFIMRGVTIAVFSPKILWPFNIFTSQPTCNLPVWVVILFAAFAMRHVIRSVLLVVGRHLDLP